MTKPIQIILAVEAGEAVLQVHNADGELCQVHELARTRTRFELAADQVGKLEGADGQAARVLLINEHPSRPLDAVLCDAESLEPEEHDILRPGGLAVLGSSKVQDLWAGDCVVLRPA